MRRKNTLNREDLTTTEAGFYASVSANTIRKWCTAGLIQYFTLPAGNSPEHRRISKRAFVVFLKKHGIPIHPDLQKYNEGSNNDVSTENPPEET